MQIIRTTCCPWMTRRRAIAGFVAMVGAAAIGAAALSPSIHAAFGHLPPPNEASRGDVLRWILHEDLQSHPEKTRFALVARLEQLLDQDVSLASHLGLQLSPAATAQAEANVELLLRAWFADKSARFTALAEEQRSTFLNRQIERAGRWQEVEAALLGTAGGDVSDLDRLLALNDRATSWVATAARDERDSQNAFLEAIRAKVVAQAAQRWFR